MVERDHSNGRPFFSTVRRLAPQAAADRHPVAGLRAVSLAARSVGRFRVRTPRRRACACFATDIALSRHWSSCRV